MYVSLNPVARAVSGTVTEMRGGVWDIKWVLMVPLSSTGTLCVPAQIATQFRFCAAFCCLRCEGLGVDKAFLATSVND